MGLWKHFWIVKIAAETQGIIKVNNEQLKSIMKVFSFAAIIKCENLMGHGDSDYLLRHGKQSLVTIALK